MNLDCLGFFPVTLPLQVPNHRIIVGKRSHLSEPPKIGWGLGWGGRPLCPIFFATKVTPAMALSEPCKAVAIQFHQQELCSKQPASVSSAMKESTRGEPFIYFAQLKTV